MSAFNTVINQPPAPNVSRQTRNDLREELAEEMAAFCAAGGVIDCIESVSAPLPLHSAPKKAQALPASGKKKKVQDTPQIHYTFKDSVVRVVVSEQGHPEIVLVDVADAIDAYRESFTTRFAKELKTYRKVITRGRAANVSLSVVSEVVRVVETMITKKPARRATFESFIRLVHQIEADIKAQAVA